MVEEFDVVVIGGGTAGLVTASGCARLGRRVALVEREALGGDCLWTGCVPTKALVASARFAYMAAHADAYGFEPSQLTVSPKRIMDSMRARRKLIEPHDAPEKFIALGIDVITGAARLTAGHKVEVNGRILHAKDIVLATGARTAVPPVPGLSEAGFLDHATFLAQDEIPPSVIILGGGYIGIEFAQIFRRFGAAVTVVEMGEQITPHEDSDVITAVRQMLEGEGVTIRTGWKATAVRREGEMRTMTIERASQTEQLTAAAIFVASGRRGNTEDLGLEDVGVSVERSYVTVDAHLQTTARHIWACGDVHGGLQFTHVAAYEAVKLVRNMLFPGNSAVSYEHIPWALYTDPEVAHIGLTEAEARKKVGDVRIYKVEMHDVDRAIVDRNSLGFLKIICDASGVILGAHAFCSNASTLLQEVVLARKHGLRIGALAQRISPYPSLSDSVGKAASQYYQSMNQNWKGALARRVAALTQ